jgi:hypothetical protein
MRPRNAILFVVVDDKLIISKVRGENAMNIDQNSVIRCSVSQLLYSACSHTYEVQEWENYRKETPTSCPEYLIGFLLANSLIRGFVYKSFVNFNWQFNLFASLENCSEQSAYQNCNILGQYCNVARTRTSILTVSTCWRLQIYLFLVAIFSKQLIE